MWGTISRTERKQKRRGLSVRFKLAAAFSLFTAALLLFVNIYPILVSRDMVISAKQSALQSQGSVISSSLSALEVLTAESVEQVVNLLDVAPVTRMLVTDQTGLILYDTDQDDSAVGRYGLLTEVAGALDGYAWFSCAYSHAEAAFTSRCATPVSAGGAITGAVFLYDHDQSQGEIIAGLQRNLRNMSALFGGAGLVIIFVLASTLTRRIKRLSAAMEVVRSGRSISPISQRRRRA